MGRHADKQILQVAALAAMLSATPLSAEAGEASFCVACSGPDQVYRCRVTGDGSIPSDALKLYCVIRTAKEGHHASCSAENATPACAGIDKVYAYDGPAIPEEIAQDPRVKSLMNRMNRENRAFEKPEGEAPKTMVELTGRALSASRQGWRNAKAAIGGGSNDAAPLPVTPQASTAQGADASADTAGSPSRMQRASAAMGSFARKSYRCLRSLFRHCRDEASGAVQ
jgi:hypothetical protein